MNTVILTDSRSECWHFLNRENVLILVFLWFTVVRSTKAVICAVPTCALLMITGAVSFMFQFFSGRFSRRRYLGDHGESKQVADAADDSDEDLSAVTLP